MRLNSNIQNKCLLFKRMYPHSKQTISSAVLLIARLTIVISCSNASSFIIFVSAGAGSNAEPMQEETFPGLDLTLGFGGSANENTASSGVNPNLVASSQNKKSQSEQLETSKLIDKILRFDYTDEFSLTENAIGSIGRLLEEFSNREQLHPNEKNANKLISSWLVRESSNNNGQNSLSNINSMVEHTAQELDLIYQTFWSTFIPLINSIVSRRPEPNGGNLNDLAFSCTSYDELKMLRQSASISTIYALFYDIFSAELYTHCLTRRLAIIKLSGIKPTPIVRQFVEIYLDMSPADQYQAQFEKESSLMMSSLKAQEKLMIELRSSDKIIPFNLQHSLRKHGPLEVAAEFVFDPSSGLAILGHKLDNKALVEKFKFECHMHMQQLQQAWSTTDDLAALLSTSSNNLFALNARLKLLAPQLVYASVCGQLITT